MSAGDVVLTVLDLIGIVAGLVLMGLGLWGLIEGEKR